MATGPFPKTGAPVIWVPPLDRAKILGLMNAGFVALLLVEPASEKGFFMTMIGVMGICGLLFLSSVNAVLYRLTAMLPDENKHGKTKHFTTLNRFILLAILLLPLHVLRAATLFPARRAAD